MNKKSSYQVLKEKNKKLLKELNEARDFERLMKELLKANLNGQEQKKEDLLRCFLKRSKRYANEVKELLGFELC